MREEIENQTWTRGLWLMSTATEIAEFIQLWDCVQEVQFSDSSDTIIWKWTANGMYSSKSAYDNQFVGSYCTFNANAIWKAKAEGKHRLFAWLLVQDKIQTADNLTRKGIACNSICCFCDQEQESAAHLCLHCVFAQQVWNLVQNWTDGLISLPPSGIGIEEWWNLMINSTTSENRNKVAAILIYTAWNIWNERNRRIFQGSSQQPTAVLGFIKEEMEVRRQALDREQSSLFS